MKSEYRNRENELHKFNTSTSNRRKYLRVRRHYKNKKRITYNRKREETLQLGCEYVNGLLLGAIEKLTLENADRPEILKDILRLSLDKMNKDKEARLYGIVSSNAFSLRRIRY